MKKSWLAGLLFAAVMLMCSVSYADPTDTAGFAMVPVYELVAYDDTGQVIPAGTVICQQDQRESMNSKYYLAKAASPPILVASRAGWNSPYLTDRQKVPIPF